MALTLTVLRCPDSVAPETRHVGGGEFSLGRGPENDWVLADPERHLSKRHCVFAFRSGAWQIADVSTNGTFLNGEAEPLGPGRVHTLRDGDRLRLGVYEIEARVQEDTNAGLGGWSQRRRELEDPFGDDPFHEPADPLREAPPATGLRSSIGLPADYDPLAPDPAEGGPTQPDHSPALEDAFRPPRPAASLLPDDWNVDLSQVSSPVQQSAPVRQAAPPIAPPVSPPIASPVAPAPQAAAPPAHEPPSDAGLMAAFMAGTGLAGPPPADAEATMRTLGRAFRAMVAGLRQAMIARAGIKSEFRIEQTMIRSRGNNPLKFSADDDDALAALLGTGRRTGMGPEEAVRDALRDMHLHELATVAAMQDAMRALLARLDPAPLEAAGRGLVPAQRKARAWDAYEKLYAATVQALSDDFDSVFGKAFARAYEQAVREAGLADGGR